MLGKHQASSGGRETLPQVSAVSEREEALNNTVIKGVADEFDGGMPSEYRLDMLLPLSMIR